MSGMESKELLYERALLKTEGENYRLRREAYQLRTENAELVSHQAELAKKLKKGVNRAADLCRDKMPCFPGEGLYRHNYTKGNRVEYTQEQLKEQRRNPVKTDQNPLFSILVCLRHPDERYLREFLTSVLDQTYAKIELCAVVIDSNDAAGRSAGRILAQASRKDHRVKYRRISSQNEKNAWNACLRMASGAVIVLAKPESLLHPAAIWRFHQEFRNNEADIVYCDEAMIGDSLLRPVSFLYKGGYGLEELEGWNLFGHLTAIRKGLQIEKPVFRPEMDGAQEYDLYLRLCERSGVSVHHVSEVLCYRRRKATAPEGDKGEAKAALCAIQDHLKRLGEGGSAELTAVEGCYRVRRALKNHPVVSIVICNRDHASKLKQCIASILQKTSWDNYEILICENGSTQEEVLEYYQELEKDPRIRILTWAAGKAFNFAAVNNYGVSQARGEYIVLLNNDTEIITEGWIEELLMPAGGKRVGAVGCMLLYPDLTIQHAGMMVRVGDSTAHMNLYENPDDPGYLGRFHRISNVSCVTAACMMIRKEVWDQMGGMDEAFRIAYNDVDLCVRLRKAGYRIVFTPFARLFHYEGQTRGFRRAEGEDAISEADEARLFHDRHGDRGWEDPYYNRHFFSGDGHFWERIPDEPEKHLQKLLMPFRGVPVYAAEGSARKYLERAGAAGVRIYAAPVPDTDEDLCYLTDPGHLDLVMPADRMVFAVGDLAGFIRGKHLQYDILDHNVICDVRRDQFLGMGFHAPESGQVWSSEEEAQIFLVLKKGNLILTVEQGHAIPFASLGWTEMPLSFALNGTHFGTGLIDAGNNGRTFRIEVPASLIEDGLNRLSIHCRLWSPSMFGSADRRMLGFSLKRITGKQKL